MSEVYVMGRWTDNAGLVESASASLNGAEVQVWERENSTGGGERWTTCGAPIVYRQNGASDVHLPDGIRHAANTAEGQTYRRQCARGSGLVSTKVRVLRAAEPNST